MDALAALFPGRQGRVSVSKVGGEQANVLSLGSLIAWLERQPAAQRYNYRSVTQCMLAQYLADAGLIAPMVCDRCFEHGPRHGRKERALPAGFDDINGHDPQTFGDALERARKMVNA